MGVIESLFWIIISLLIVIASILISIYILECFVRNMTDTIEAVKKDAFASMYQISRNIMNLTRELKKTLRQYKIEAGSLIDHIQLKLLELTKSMSYVVDKSLMGTLAYILIKPASILAYLVRMTRTRFNV